MKKIIICVLIVMLFAPLAYAVNAGVIGALLANSGTVATFTLTDPGGECAYSANGIYTLQQGGNQTATVNVTISEECGPGGPIATITLVNGGEGYSLGAANVSNGGPGTVNITATY